MNIFLLGAFAIASASALAAFTNQNQPEKKRADAYFIYLPNTPGTVDGDYEDTTKWMHSVLPPIGCEGGEVTCFIVIDEENLTVGDTPRARLVNFLKEQDGDGVEFPNDLAAVSALTDGFKSEN